MTENQYRVREQQEQKQKQKIGQQSQEAQVKNSRCPNCNTVYSDTDNYCPGCGENLKPHACVRCGAATESHWEICPQCGQNLHAECCSFCGAATNSDDTFCPECGNPKTGITCPGCQTLNFRSFCRKCNTPLNALAHEALQQIRQKPELQKALAIAEELAKLEELISQAGEEAVEETEVTELSEENRVFVNQYKDLLAAFRGQEQGEKSETTKPHEPEPKPQKKFSLSIPGKEEAMAQYNAKLEEMKNTLNAMFPDPDMTPQMQRDYYTAIKVEMTVRTTVKVKIGWKCNAYGCIHTKPNECAEPFRGGKWIYDNQEKDSRIWVRQ